jgi:hypothetical protein
MRTHYDAQIEAKRLEAERLLREAEQLEHHRELFVESQETIAKVQFHGHAKIYHYRIEGGPFDIGDYARVWSPLSGQNELVRIVGRGMTQADILAMNRAGYVEPRVAILIDNAGVLGN